MRIKAVLQAKTTIVEQESLHKNDQDTIWFGIIRDDTAIHSFRDYGRYAAIMNQTLGVSRQKSSRLAPDIYDHRFPSLVSFVGQTGSYMVLNVKNILTY